MMKKYFNLFFTFFKIGLVTFGGGYAMISIIYKESVEKNNWISKEEMNNIVVVAESTPGPIAINSATFIGYKVGKFFGATLAVIGVSLPSLIIILLISMFLMEFNSIEIVRYAFEGIRAGIIVLMIEAIFKLSNSIKKNALYYALIIVAFVMKFFFNVSAILIILVGIFIGLFREIFSNKRGKENA